MDSLLQGLRAAAEPTRLRIIALCAHGELTVSDLVQILGQSQPRVSRHLRLLVEAGLLERNQEGNWAWYRLAQRGAGAELARIVADLVPDRDPLLTLDLERLERVKAARAEHAAEYFRRNAGDWDRVRALHVDNDAIDAALKKLLLGADVTDLLDIGTGTGSVLQLVGGDVGAAVGVDLSREMLQVARANLARNGLANCQVRQADMYQLPFPAGSFDAVTLHMVLHFAEEPARVLAEAARVLKPGGRIVVVDFARHAMTALAEGHQHRWLGFPDAEIEGWFADCGLLPAPPVRLEGSPLTVCLWSAARPANDVLGGGATAPRAAEA
ncbi:MAG: metalloregulator ArsR/SmtB family transcription factor [Rhodospirillaceae bacterium]|nr:metalloregulator ArsR/SmtB family transcription factor [Rhodospirillaceae bacterium]